MRRLTRSDAAGERDGDWTAPARCQEVKAAKRGSVDDTFEIANPIVERKIARIAVRQAAAAGVITQ